MGVCASCRITEREKAQQERQAAAKQRRLVIEASEPVRLLSTSQESELAVHEVNTVLGVLGVAVPKAAVASPKLEFSGATISHDKTSEEAGQCDQAKIILQGEDEAKAKTGQADKVGTRNAAQRGKANTVQGPPDRVFTIAHFSTWRPPRAMRIIVLG